MQAIREALKKNPVLHRLGKELKASAHALGEEVRHHSWRRQRRVAVTEYLANTAEPKLHIGCGPMVLQGWLNTDLLPQRDRGVVYLDIVETLPFPDATFQYIYSEHLIEHVPLSAGLRHFKECHRVLRAGGTLRVATPDLQFLLDYFAAPAWSDVQNRFLSEMLEEFQPGLPLRSPTILLNEFVRDWGHQFIYDYQVLRQVLELAGFRHVDRCGVRHSSHDALAGLEQHGTAISEAYNELQTMVLEGTKTALA